MGFFKQLFLLLWKNITYRRRNKVTTSLSSKIRNDETHDTQISSWATPLTPAKLWASYWCNNTLMWRLMEKLCLFLGDITNLQSLSLINEHYWWFDAQLTPPLFSSCADPADHWAPLATLPLCHPHICSSFKPFLQTRPMWVKLYLLTCTLTGLKNGLLPTS